MLCREIQSYLHDYAEKTLAQDKRPVIEDHLQTCEGCQKELSKIKNTIHLTRQLEEHDPPSHLADRIMSHIRIGNRGWSPFRRYIMKPVPVPAGALALILMFFAALYLYRASEPTGEKPEAPLASQTIRSQNPDGQSASDQNLKALVRQPPENSSSYERKAPESPDFSDLRAVIAERMLDLDIVMRVENVRVGAKKILEQILQLEGDIFNAELSETEYRISAGIKSARKTEFFDSLSMVGKAEVVTDKQAQKDVLRIRISIIEKQTSS